MNILNIIKRLKKMCKKIENSLVMIINGKNEKGDIDGNIDFVGKIF